MKILGIDPGLNLTGYGVVDASGVDNITVVEAGVVRTKARNGIAERLSKIYNSLNDLVSDHKPEALILEKIYSHYKHPATSILMGHARGVICLVAGLRGVPLINFPSTRIKKAITGKGHASKAQVQRMVVDTLKLKETPEPVDITDALALAVAYVMIEDKNKKLF